jgi:hypothetical protein
MVLFELLQLFGIFSDYPGVEYLWHDPIMPSTKRNGIRTPFGRSPLRGPRQQRQHTGAAVRIVREATLSLYHLLDGYAVAPGDLRQCRHVGGPLAALQAPEGIEVYVSKLRRLLLREVPAPP